jgi:hypothetical protein
MIKKEQKMTLSAAMNSPATDRAMMNRARVYSGLVKAMQPPLWVLGRLAGPDPERVGRFLIAGRKGRCRGHLGVPVR